MNIEVNAQERIFKPIEEVFEAIIDPKKMVHYFISSASAPLEAGKKIVWEFADVNAEVIVNVIEIEKPHTIIFDWYATGAPTRVTMKLTCENPGITTLTINEKEFRLNEEGVKKAMGQTAGWTYFLCCFKAYLQYDVNLRKGLKRRITDVER